MRHDPPTPRPARPAEIWTGSGYLDLISPCAAQIRLGDIAAGLSRIARFGGHTAAPWTVADHSLYCADLAEARGLPAPLVLAALMHDAPEAYCGDVVRPLKALLPRYRAIEAGIWRAIAARFALPRALPPEIKEIDALALATEKRDLCPGAGDWPGLPAPDAAPLPREFSSARAGARAFLGRARALLRDRADTL